jgi:concanavalin A-like lectin/glucanase superfamily protein/type IX secretion system substrate protein
MKTTILSIFFVFLLSISNFAQHAINAIDIGAVDYVEVADNGNGSLDIGNGFTIEAWILTGSAQSNQKVAGKIAGDFKNGFILGVQDGQVNMEIFDDSGTQTVLQVGEVPDTIWTHIAGTYEVGGMLTIYINGQNVGQVAASAGVHNFNSNPFRIGIAPWDTNALGFFGYIDEVRYWNDVLDGASIRDWMHKDLSSDHPSFSNLGMYHKYDEGIDLITADQSTNGNNGTINGGLWIPSTVPFKGVFDLYENEVRGVWFGQNEASSDIFTLTGSGLLGDQSIVFSNSGGDLDFNTSAPAPYDKRLSKSWRVTTQGSLEPSLGSSFDLSQVDLTDVADVGLLVSSTPDFNTASAIVGTLNGITYTVPAEVFFDGLYYTLAFTEEGVSTDELYTSDQDFRITPNPNNGQFQMILENSETEELDLKLMDLTGKIIFGKNIFAGQGTFSTAYDFSDLAKGVYFLQIDNKERASTRKIIIE